MISYKGRIITWNSRGMLQDFEGYITVKDGIIVKIGRDKPGEYVDYGDYLIVPGFIDTHIHLPQISVRGKWSTNLLAWLEKYVFPEEMRFLNADYAEKRSREFFQELLRNGTTTAVVYGPPNVESTDLAFEIAREYGLRIFMGQTLMDTNVPEELITDVDRAIDDVKLMWKKWKDRYILTLRFAISCSFELMKRTAEFARGVGLRIQTHISEQVDEVEKVKEYFYDDYSRVYDRAGVLYQKTLLAHGIHLSDYELELISRRKAKIVHCPSSNFFLHSGVMNMKRIKGWGIGVSLGSDVGGGPYVNMLNVMRDTYYANPLTPGEIFRLATLEGARVLGIENVTGSLEEGKYADFIVVEPPNIDDTQELLANLIFYGGEKNIVATFVKGEQKWISG